MLKKKGAGKILLTAATVGTAASSVAASTSTSAGLFNFFSNKEKAEKRIGDKNEVFVATGVATIAGEVIGAFVGVIATASLFSCLAVTLLGAGLGYTFGHYAIAENKFKPLWRNSLFLEEKTLNRLDVEDDLNNKFSISVKKINSGYCVDIRDRTNENIVKSFKANNGDAEYSPELSSSNFEFRITRDENRFQEIGDIEIIDKNASDDVIAKCEADILFESDKYIDRIVDYSIEKKFFEVELTAKKFSDSRKGEVYGQDIFHKYDASLSFSGKSLGNFKITEPINDKVGYPCGNELSDNSKKELLKQLLKSKELPSSVNILLKLRSSCYMETIEIGEDFALQKKENKESPSPRDIIKSLLKEKNESYYFGNVKNKNVPISSIDSGSFNKNGNSKVEQSQSFSIVPEISTQNTNYDLLTFDEDDENSNLLSFNDESKIQNNHLALEEMKQERKN